MKITEKGKFIWGSILFPIIIAVATVTISSIVAYNIYQKQEKKELEPVLFRVKSIVDNNKQTKPVTINYGDDIFRILAYMDSIGEISGTEELMTIHKKGGTVSLNFPQFLMNQNLKNQMRKNIDFLAENSDIDEILYFLVKDLEDFLRQYTIPEVSNVYELAKTKWNNKDVLEQWNNHIIKLQRWYNIKHK
jgi:hypothetical protein